MGVLFPRNPLSGRLHNRVPSNEGRHFRLASAVPFNVGRDSGWMLSTVGIAITNNFFLGSPGLILTNNRSFSCGNLAGNTCILRATAGTVEVGRCSKQQTLAVGGRPLPYTQTVASGVKETVVTYSLFAPMYQLNFQQRDLAKTTGAIDATNAENNSPGGASPTNQTGQDASQNQTLASGGLGRGAQVGIGVGVSLGGVVVGLLVAFFLWKRRQARRAAQESTLAGTWDSPESALETKPTDQAPSEMHVSPLGWMAEVQGPHRIVELPHEPIPQELDPVSR